MTIDQLRALKSKTVLLPDGTTGHVSFFGCADCNGKMMVEVVKGNDDKKCYPRKLYYPEDLKEIGNEH